VSYLLDTNVCIAFLNDGKSNVGARLARLSPDEVRLCAVVKAELLYGARHSSRVEENLGKLARFFELFESYPFDDVAAEHYGVLRAQTRRAGTPLGANDLLIAAIALSLDLTLVTRNQEEFRRVAGLRVESW
jgi:tRNA(fMet)-specific endonuclease VapC